MKNSMKALALLLLVVIAVPAAAQSLTGVITGTVKDEQGGALPGVNVTLTGKTGTKTATTDTGGSYRFVALDPGTYSVQTQMTGVAPKRQDNIVVNVDRHPGAAIALKIGGPPPPPPPRGRAPGVPTTSG